MKKEMLINVLQSEECRIAILEEGVLEELYVERASNESYVGNIYKGRIVNIEPSIQAAFVDFGVGRNGFLHVSDVEPTYWRHLERGRNGDRPDRGGRDGDRDRDRGRGRDRAQLPAYLQGMDFDDLDDRPARVGRTLVNEPRDDFAAGVEVEPPSTVEASDPTPPAVRERAEVRERVEDSPPEVEKPTLKAHPETVVEEEGKTRRRSRGTTSRRRSRATPATEEPATEEAKAEEAPPPEPKPRLM